MTDCDSQCERSEGYDHVHRPDRLPRRRRTDGHLVTHGYAAGLWGDFGNVWAFFDDLEPALVFGRSGRMGLGVDGYGVFRAAHEVRSDGEGDRLDVCTLHLVGDNLDRQDNEAEAFARWVQGVDPRSAYWQPPKR